MKQEYCPFNPLCLHGTFSWIDAVIFNANSRDTLQKYPYFMETNVHIYFIKDA